MVLAFLIVSNCFHLFLLSAIQHLIHLTVSSQCNQSGLSVTCEMLILYIMHELIICGKHLNLTYLMKLMSYRLFYEMCHVRLVRCPSYIPMYGPSAYLLGLMFSVLNYRFRLFPRENFETESDLWLFRWLPNCFQPQVLQSLDTE